MVRKWLLTVLTSIGLLAGMAAVAPAAEAHPYDRGRDRDEHRDRRDDRGRDRDGPLSDPGTLVGFRGQNGHSFLIEVTGNVNAGSVWGSGLYTDDSALAAAVVHAGVLADGQTGVVKVTVLPGAGGYRGTDRNGVASGDWGDWVGSYRVDR